MELLIVVTIIAMLAGMVLGALNSARETARKAKTRATIAKIDKHIMTKYESYRSRRLPLSRAEMEALATSYYAGVTSQTLARVRMNALRDLMRMEMPDRWNDVVEDNKVRNPVFLPANRIPSLTQRYANAYLNSSADLATKDYYGWAECLYAIVMSMPGAAQDFQDNEVGDLDGDGLREFHDAWGHPILFIRWPAGFLPEYGADTELQTRDAPDPFDPYRILGPQQSYVLYPLIYSAGPDGIPDVNVGHQGSNYATYRYVLTKHPDYDVWDLNPYVTDSDPVEVRQIGLPADPTESAGSSGDEVFHKNNRDDWYDNIHNHHFDLR